MKKAICFGLAALFLLGLLSGCDLQNRKPSAEFVPETQPTEYAEPPVIEAPETEPTEATVAVMQVVVHDLLFEQGEYYDRYGNKYNYSYRLPYIDGESRYASGCNSEINKNFGSEINAQLNAMDNGSLISVLSADYETRLRGDFLSVYITMERLEGEQAHAVYTVYSDTGDKVPNNALLEWYRLDEETFLELVKEAVEARFEEQYGDYTWEQMLQYNSARDRTMKSSNFSVDMPIYFDEMDRLIVLAPIYDLAGEKHTESVVIEYEPPEETEETEETTETVPG